MAQNEQANTLRRLAYYLHAQDVIGDEYPSELTPEEQEWWKANVDSGDRSIFYTDSLYEAWEWLQKAADDIEAGRWSLPDRFYEDDPE